MPPEIFESPITLEHTVIQHDPNFLEVERIEFDHGIRIYLKGHLYPQLGMPTPQAIWAVNIVKSLIKHGMILFVLNRTAWKSIGWRALEQHILKYEFLTPTAQGIYDFIVAFNGDTQLAKILAHVIEYDGAYRFRLMDLMTETDFIALNQHPIKELKRLFAVHKQRDYQEVSDKLGKLHKLSYFLLWPPLRKRFRYALAHTELSKLCFNEIDEYWAKQKTDYKYHV